MNNSTSILIEVDKLLDRVSVRGEDVFVLSDARKLLKLVFDELLNADVKDGDDNGG